MLLLTEEIGELAKAVRKSATSMAIDYEKIQNYDTVDVERITRMVQMQAEKFAYIKRKSLMSSFYRQQTLFDMGGDSKRKEKLLIFLIPFLVEIYFW